MTPSNECSDTEPWAWGLFVMPGATSAHLVPTARGMVANGHVLDPFRCWCWPVNRTAEDAWVYRPLWEHKDAFWPGSSDPSN